MKTILLTAFITSSLTACAVEPMLPSYAAVEVNHTSHIEQHFQPEPTSFGYNALQLDLHWTQGRFYLDLADGVVLGSCTGVGEYRSCEGLEGPREVFTGRAGIVLFAKP